MSTIIQNHDLVQDAAMADRRPEYVYVASSWRNHMQPAVIAALTAAGIDCYDFKNPPAGTGFSWAEVKDQSAAASSTVCQNCSQMISYAKYRDIGGYEPDYDPATDTEQWRHFKTGYASCLNGKDDWAVPKKGSDWEQVDEYLRMISHPRAVEGFDSDFEAMQRADTFVMVLPCGKSAHLELGWAIGAGKRTLILLEDPVEPELMYRMAGSLVRDLDALLIELEV